MMLWGLKGLDPTRTQIRLSSILARGAKLLGVGWYQELDKKGAPTLIQ